jgi:hypothetical protein
MKQSLPPASLLLLFLCFSSVFAFIPHRTLLLDNNLSDERRFLSNKEIWFNQTLDHFSPYVLYFHNPPSFDSISTFIFMQHRVIYLFMQLYFCVYN